ncbi:Protein of unknown function, partial [Cotesia congregata]
MTQNNWSSLNNNRVDSSIKVLKKYKTSRYCSIILQVNTSLHGSILNNGKIRYGWNSYKVYNHISVIRCYKCWGLNHTANKCTKDEKCRKCGEHHHENQCNSLVKKCVNCIELVNKQKDENIDVHHEATNLKVVQKKLSTLSILAVNVCGLLKHKDDIDLLISDHKPDILCLNETHVIADILDDEITFANYDSVRTDSNNSRTGGVVTYILKNIKFSVVFNSSEASENTWLHCIEIKGISGKFYLCN